MGKSDRPRAEVKRGGGPGASREVALEAGVRIEEFSKFDYVI